MPSLYEMRSIQKRTLYSYLKIQKENSGIIVKELEETIDAYKAEMEQEDIAIVMQRIEELYAKK